MTWTLVVAAIIALALMVAYLFARIHSDGQPKPATDKSADVISIAGDYSARKKAEQARIDAMDKEAVRVESNRDSGA